MLWDLVQPNVMFPVRLIPDVILNQRRQRTRIEERAARDVDIDKKTSGANSDRGIVTSQGLEAFIESFGLCQCITAEVVKLVLSIGCHGVLGLSSVV